MQLRLGRGGLGLFLFSEGRTSDGDQKHGKRDGAQTAAQIDQVVDDSVGTPHGHHEHHYRLRNPFETVGQMVPSALFARTPKRSN